MEKKKLMQLFAALFIALIFISSYVSLTSYSKNNATTTVQKVPQTVYASGVSNAIITSYGSVMNINVACTGNASSASAVQKVTNSLNILESNNSVLNFYAVGNKFAVDMGNVSSYSAYKYITRGLSTNESKCANFTTTGTAVLPGTITMSVQYQAVSIIVPQSMLNTTVPVTFQPNMSNRIRLKVAALLTQNGTIFGNLSIIRLPPLPEYAIGMANAMILGYGKTLGVSASCNNAIKANTQLAAISNSLAVLKSNNSILSYNSVGSSALTANAGSISTYSAYKFISAQLGVNGTSCTAFTSTAKVSLPPFLNVSTSSQTVKLNLTKGYQNGTMAIIFQPNMSSIAKVKVAALLAPNYTIIGNLTVTKA